MWFFIDESWPPPTHTPQFGVLLGVLLKNDQLRTLEDFLYAVRRKYYGQAHARNLAVDLKGKDLLSRHSLRIEKGGKAVSTNLCIVRELLSFPEKTPDFYLKAFASTVYTMNRQPPDLLSPNPAKLSDPFRELLQNVSAAARECSGAEVRIIIDQRLGQQEKLSISIKRFIAGTGLPNIHPYPYFAVSNISPGVQVADIFAHLLSMRVQKKRDIMELYRNLIKLQWVSSRTPPRYGFVRFNETITNNQRTYQIRRRW